MSTVRRSVLTMAAYLLGLVLLFGAAFVFLSGIGGGDPSPAPVVQKTRP
jgi:hypothetical protein